MEVLIEVLCMSTTSRRHEWGETIPGLRRDYPPDVERVFQMHIGCVLASAGLVLDLGRLCVAVLCYRALGLIFCHRGPKRRRKRMGLEGAPRLTPCPLQIHRI